MFIAVIIILVGSFIVNRLEKQHVATIVQPVQVAEVSAVAVTPSVTATAVTTPVVEPEIAPKTDPVPVAQPDVTPKVYTNKTLIVDYSLNLDFSDTTANSIRNAKLALDIINGENGFLLKSGETFSFNDVVGVRTYGRGFLNAPLIEGSGVGGGVCKASTAVYQAAHEADLYIIERHNHSKRVQYALPGTDAAVSYGTLDNVFQNNSGYDLLFECSLDDNIRVAYVKIYRLTSGSDN